jgi:carboxylate-amine ligase
VLSDGYVVIAELRRGDERQCGSTLSDLRADLSARHRVLVDTAATLGLGLVAAGAVPLSVPLRCA